MCGRYALTSSWEAVAALAGAVAADPYAPRYNISPGQTVHAVAAADGRRTMGRFRWGLASGHGEDGHGALAYNARVESAAQRPPFAGALQVRRCLVPADAWYAWKTIGRFKQPYMIRRADRAPIFFAALWDHWLEDGGDDRALAILTRPAGADLADVVDRTPVVVGPEFWDAWLDPRVDGASLVLRRLKPTPEGALEAIPIGARINQIDVEGPELQQPAPAPAHAEAMAPRLV